ncbi:MAG: hypothetical protein ACHQ2Z_11585 [Elusimicrobiota bacterium]
MAKATSRKHATHNKKSRAHHAVKAPAHRAASKSSAASRPMVVQPDAEIIDEEFTSRSETRVVDDLDDEVGIYGPSRGEDAG